MQTIAEMLMSEKDQPNPAPISKRTAFNPTAVLLSMEKNSDKPCTKCESPERHRAKSGRIFTTLCTKCYTDRQAKYRGKPKHQEP